MTLSACGMTLSAVKIDLHACKMIPVAIDMTLDTF